MIEVVVNGEGRQVAGGLSVLELLHALGVEPDRVAVELNRTIVQKPVWAQTRIEAGARIEIVQFVGGG